MPLLPLFLLLLLPFVILIALPFSIVQRYRLGTARRLARPWVATTNFVLMIFSAAVFVWGAALTNFWVPRAFAYSLIGLASGGVLGVIGVAVTRWERGARTLHYTPNRWLVLLLTAAVALRVLYSFWRGWHAWQTSGRGGSWLEQAGAAGALGVGAIVLGYYLVYAAGVWRRTRQQG